MHCGTDNGISPDIVPPGITHEDLVDAIRTMSPGPRLDMIQRLIDDKNPRVSRGGLQFLEAMAGFAVNKQNAQSVIDKLRLQAAR